MKNILTQSALLACLILFLGGCKGGGINFDINNSTEFTVPSSLIIDLPYNLPTADMESNSEQAFANNDTKVKWVKEISLEAISLEIVSPSGEDFSFLSRMLISISADGLDEVEIASLDPVPVSAGSRIELIPTNVNLADYIKKEEYTLHTSVVMDESPLYEITFRTDLTFDVVAQAPLFQ